MIDFALRRERGFLLALLAAPVPAVGVALALAWISELTPISKWVITALVAGAWVSGALVVKREITRAFQAISNLLSALSHGDFSVRGRRTSRDDAIGAVFAQLGDLAEVLVQQRAGAMDART